MLEITKDTSLKFLTPRKSRLLCCCCYDELAQTGSGLALDAPGDNLTAIANWSYGNYGGYGNYELLLTLMETLERETEREREGQIVTQHCTLRQP